MRVAVIGASGFLGRTLSRTLLDGGHDVFGYGRARQRPARVPSGVRWCTYDALGQTPQFPDDCGAVFYLSQSTHYRDFANHSEDVLAVNTVGASRTARAASAAGVRFFCYASTGSVYAPSFSPLAEDAPVRRDNGYVLSKLCAEECLPLVAGDMPHTSLRVFGLFGPGQTAMLVPRLHDRVVRREPITLRPAPEETSATGGFRISLCYVNDAAHCLAAVMELAVENGTSPRVLNLAGPTAVSIRELCEAIGRIAGMQPIFQTLAQQRDFDLHADVSQLQALLKPRFTNLNSALEASFGSEDHCVLPQAG